MTWGEVTGVITALTALAVLVSGYVQLVLKRSLLPCIEFDADFAVLTRTPDRTIGELELMMRNVGTTLGVVTNVQCRLRHGPSGGRSLDGIEPFLPNVVTLGGTGKQRAVRHPEEVGDLNPTVDWRLEALGPRTSESPLGESWFYLVRPRTFIQPGVTQWYRKPITLPANAELMCVWASFDYRIQTGPITRFLIGILSAPPKGLDWRDGVRNHTVRRTFPIAAQPPDDEESSRPGRAD